MAYYNEHDPFAAQWLLRLMKGGCIQEGVVNDRSIEDVQPYEVDGYTRVHFFAGIGGWDHALNLAGWPVDRPVWTGSCPCQPFSVAGKGGATNDPRHLWPAWFRHIRQRRPDTIFGEQVGSPAGRAWLDIVASDLEGEGYAVGAAVLGAHSVGAPHKRQRIFFAAVVDAIDTGLGRYTGNVDDRRESGRVGAESNGSVAETGPWSNAEPIFCADGKARLAEPGIFPLAHGVPDRVGRLRGYGNAIVPQVAAEFIAAFMETEQ